MLPAAGQVVRQQFGLPLDQIGKILLKDAGGAGVQFLPAHTKQRAVGGVLDQRVFEPICRLRRYATTEQQPGIVELSKCRTEVRLRPLCENAGKSALATCTASPIPGRWIWCSSRCSTARISMKPISSGWRTITGGSNSQRRVQVPEPRMSQFESRYGVGKRGTCAEIRLVPSRLSRHPG